MKNDNNFQTANTMDIFEENPFYATARETDPIVNGDDDDDLNQGDTTLEDIALLDATDYDSSTDSDDENLKNAELDDTDEDGEALNEKSSAVDFSGKDLDLPGSDEDDADENIGEEDEENNSYSEADTE